MKLSITVLTILIVAVVIFSDCASSRRVKPPSKIKKLLELLKKDHLQTRESMMHVPVVRKAIQERVNCSGDLHMCDDGTECILQSWVCDGGAPDCDDGSDESNCRTTPCYANRFKCADTGRCIRAPLHCNYQNDCADGSDEVDCPPMTCRPDYFKCPNASRCIPSGFLCDGDNDCGDLSDETDCGSRPCPLHRPVRCETTGECKGVYALCDGYPHCSDGSDEFNCSSIPCPLERPLRCTSDGTCRYEGERCDGYPQCIDGSDELNCTRSTTTSAPVHCTSDQFQCANQARCIPQRWVCDGDNDCSDRSDEANCGDRSTKVSPSISATTQASSHTGADDDDEDTSSDTEASGAPEVETSETVGPEVGGDEITTQASEEDIEGNDCEQHRSVVSTKKMLRRQRMKSRKALEYALGKMTG